jgi:hypothetical protein
MIETDQSHDATTIGRDVNDNTNTQRACSGSTVAVQREWFVSKQQDHHHHHHHHHHPATLGSGHG